MNKDKQLLGYPPDTIELNYWFYGCADPDCPPISAELRNKMWDMCKPSMKGSGRVEVFSTVGENKFKEIWDDSNNNK